MAFRAFHWHPVRSTKKIASIAARSGTRGLWQPKGCPGRGGRSGAILAHSSSGSRQPSSRTAVRAILTSQRQRLELGIMAPDAYRDRL